jgi:hypothetical protein
VDDLYRIPPRSTQQIMHPALYFDHRAAPAVITVGGYQAVLKDWQKFEENTIGELQLQMILKNTLGTAAPEAQLADRWAGDRMVTLRKGDSLSVLWIVVLDDDASAARFARS